LAHEARIGMTVPANLNDLSRTRLADVSLGAIHRFQTHFCPIAAVASDTAEAFCSVDVRLVQLDGLREIVDAKRAVAYRAGFSLGLRISNRSIGYESRTKKQSGQPHRVAPTDRRT